MSSALILRSSITAPKTSAFVGIAGVIADGALVWTSDLEIWVTLGSSTTVTVWVTAMCWFVLDPGFFNIPLSGGSANFLVPFSTKVCPVLTLFFCNNKVDMMEHDQLAIYVWIAKEEIFYLLFLLPDPPIPKITQHNKGQTTTVYSQQYCGKESTFHGECAVWIMTNTTLNWGKQECNTFTAHDISFYCLLQCLYEKEWTDYKNVYTLIILDDYVSPTLVLVQSCGTMK